MLSLEEIKALATLANEFDPANVNNNVEPLILGRFDKPSRYRFEGKVVAKQRARVSKGRAFTPAETRKCEASIAKWAKDVGFEAVTYPIAVSLDILEAAPKDDPELILHSILGAVHHQKGDIDNFAKTVLDALNGIAYKDDKQINRLHLTRRYARTPGFRISIQRNGLSKSEYINFRKMCK